MSAGKSGVGFGSASAEIRVSSMETLRGDPSRHVHPRDGREAGDLAHRRVEVAGDSADRQIGIGQVVGEEGVDTSYPAIDVGVVRSWIVWRQQAADEGIRRCGE